MTDILFDLKGGRVPEAYAFFLWNEVARILPWLERQEFSGILPLKGSISGGEMLLPLRAKLALRIPEASVPDAQKLTGNTLDIGGEALQIGTGRRKLLEAYPTLHAHLVESEKTEADFLEEVAEQLAALDIACKWICGRKQTLKIGAQTLSGYSLVLHDLKPAASIRLQKHGLGKYRRFGCGIFVPHKTIAGLD